MHPYAVAQLEGEQGCACPPPPPMALQGYLLESLCHPLEILHVQKAVGWNRINLFLVCC